MYITSVEINNFRSFQGYHNFDFKFRDNCNLNVILGKSGVGKSVFVDAIYWCLYGKEILDFPNQPIYNYASFEELDVDNELSVIVTCKFENNGEIYEVKRELYFIKKPNNKIIQGPSPNLNIFIHTSDNSVVFMDKPFFDKFPEFLFSFLFYDDENNDFFNQEYDISLKMIIFRLGMFDIINSTNSHVKLLLNQYIKEIKKIDSKREDFALLLSREDKILKNIDETQKEMDDIHNQKQKLIEELHKINIDISTHSKEANNLIQRRSALSNELIGLDERINDFEIRIQKLLFKSFPGLVLFSKYGEGNELDNLINNPNFLNSNFSLRYHQIKQLYDNLSDVDYIEKEYKRLRELKNMYTMRRAELDEINNCFDVIDDTNIKGLVSRKGDVEKSIQMLDMKLVMLKKKNDSLNKGLIYNETGMKKFNESQFSHDIVHRRIVFCKDAHEFGQQLKIEFSNHILSKIEGYCNHIFFHHFGMGSKFRKIVLNDSCDIQIIKHSNQILSVNDLSSSEKKLIRLALIFSIYHCFGLEFPIILMDPFSKLDIDKIKGLFNFIFEETNNQVIFILNDTSYNNYIKQVFLKDNVVIHELSENYNGVEVISYEN